MIAVWTKNRQIPNVLLDGGSGVNFITDTLMKKLGIEKQLEVAPFTIKMADQMKVTPLGVIKNLKINIGGLTFKITVTVIKMENQENNYSMLLGRPWLTLMTLSPCGWEAFPRPGAPTRIRITWAFLPPAPQVPGVTLGSPFCPWCFGHPLWKGVWHLLFPSKRGGRKLTTSMCKVS
jgi:hypothetical protein